MGFAQRPLSTQCLELRRETESSSGSDGGGNERAGFSFRVSIMDCNLSSFSSAANLLRDSSSNRAFHTDALSLAPPDESPPRLINWRLPTLSTPLKALPELEYNRLGVAVPSMTRGVCAIIVPAIRADAEPVALPATLPSTLPTKLPASLPPPRADLAERMDAGPWPPPSKACSKLFRRTSALESFGFLTSLRRELQMVTSSRSTRRFHCSER
mmetsp:Transcript_98543/g.283256  ORF Transcript_98543/g.283256 Transcript_98543/m.283256 type:complete len:213 (+) Transcript_98543:84-722(+)